MNFTMVTTLLGGLLFTASPDGTNNTNSAAGLLANNSNTATDHPFPNPLVLATTFRARKWLCLGSKTACCPPEESLHAIVPQAPLSTDQLAAHLELLGPLIVKIAHEHDRLARSGILDIFHCTGIGGTCELQHSDKYPDRETAHDRTIQSMLLAFASKIASGKRIQSIEIRPLNREVQDRQLLKVFLQRCECGISILIKRNNISLENSCYSHSDWISQWARAYIEAIKMLENVWECTGHLQSVHHNLQEAVEHGRQISLGDLEVIPRCYLPQDRYKDCEKYLQSFEPAIRWEQEVWLQGVVDVLGARLNATVPTPDVVAQMKELKQSLEYIRLEASLHF